MKYNYLYNSNGIYTIQNKNKLRRRDRQHISHKIYLNFSEMVFKVMNFNLVKKKMKYFRFEF